MNEKTVEEKARVRNLFINELKVAAHALNCSVTALEAAFSRIDELEAQLFTSERLRAEDGTELIQSQLRVRELEQKLAGVRKDADTLG